MQNKGFDLGFIEKLKEKNDIVSTLSRYITLTKKGKNYWACCPFHHENTPSFAINEVEQYYHCFGCGEKGDVITFVQKYESVDFMEALKILCKASGLEMPDLHLDENSKLKKEKRDKLFEVNKQAAIYFHNNLKDTDASVANEYLNMRKISPNSIVRFGLGYSKDWDGLVKHLHSKGFTDEIMKDAGLINIKNGHPYDIMAGRLMFPLINAYGDVVGFSARILTKEKFAKYRNTEQTDIFNKSEVIYGINLIKKQHQQKGVDYILLVEGQIDVISLHQAGFTTAIATLGTALTTQHAKELSRYSKNIIVCFDGDGAGQKAALRSLDILKDQFYIRVASIPNGSDPDEFVKKYGNEEFQKLLDIAEPLNDYKLHSLAEKYDLNNNYEKNKYVMAGLKIISEISSLTEQDIYLALLSKIANVSIDNLKRDLSTTDFKNEKIVYNEQDEPNEIQELPNAYIEASRFIIASLLEKKDYAYFFKDIDFMNSSLQKMYNYFLKFHMDGKSHKISNIFEVFDIEGDTEIKSVLNYKFRVAEDKEKAYYNDCLMTLKVAQIESEISRFKLEYDKEKDLTKKSAIAQKMQKLTKGKHMPVEEI